MGGHLKFGMWIMATGLMLGAGLFFMAVLDVDPWKDPGYSYAPPIAIGAPSPHRGDKSGRACSSCHQIINPKRDLAIPFVPPIVSGVPSPHRDGRENQACSRCHRILSQKSTAANQVIKPEISQNPTPKSVPVAMLSSPPTSTTLDFEEMEDKFQSIRFQGKVLAVVGKSPSSGRNNVNILVNDGVNQPSWYNLAPDWYLQAKKCFVFYGLYIKGVAFKEIGNNNALRYGQSMSVNGQLCQLRNSHMEGLWNPTAIRHGTTNEESDFE